MTRTEQLTNDPPTRKEFGPAGIVSSVLLIAVSANLVAAVLGWFGWVP